VSELHVPMIRTSERGDFKHCQWYWWHHWQNGLTTPRVPTWSWFGTAWHYAQEKRYPPGTKRGSLADVIDAFVEKCDEEHRMVYEKGGDLDQEEAHDGIELGKAMLVAYVKHWGEDKQWQVIHTEQPFQIDVRHPTSGRLIAVYCGTWDLFVWDRFDRVYRLVDHKTRASFLRDWSHFEVLDQPGSYLWVAPEVLVHLGLLNKKDAIDGITFNMARKAMPQAVAEDGIKYTQPKKSDFVAAITQATGLVESGGKPFDKHTLKSLALQAKTLGLDVKGKPYTTQPAPSFARYTTRRGPGERVRQAQKVIGEARHMEAVRRGKLPLMKNTGEHCSRCPLFDFCMLDEQDKDRAQEYAATMLVKRDPYADHREAMETKGGIIVEGDE